MSRRNDMEQSRDVEFCAGPTAELRIQRLRRGLKYMNVAALMFAGVIVLGFAYGALDEHDLVTPLLGLAGLLALLIGTIGMVYGLMGLEAKTWVIVLCVLTLVFLPGLGLISLFVVLRKTTGALKEAGLQVGLMGAEAT